MIEQTAKLEGGRYDGAMCKLLFPLPFYRGMKITVNKGDIYVVRNGPISEAIEKTQKGIEHGCILLKSWDIMDNDERAELEEFLKQSPTPEEIRKANV